MASGIDAMEAAGGGNRAAVAVCVMVATIMVALDSTIANVVLPDMQGGLGATQDQASWVLTSYIVASAIMTAPAGWLADRFGRKRVFLMAVAGFTAASALCGMAQSIEQMVAFRILQGMFGGPLVPLSQATLLDSYPKARHGQAMAMFAMGVMAAPIIGPTLGGLLTELQGWRWVFYVNLPVGAVCLLGLSVVLPDTRGRRGLGFDAFGFGVLSLFVAALQMLLDRGERLGWLSSFEIQICAAVAVAALWMFVVHSATADRPFLDPGVFRDRNLAAALVFIFLVGIILLATLALLAPYMQTLMGYPVLTAGMALAPRGMGTVIALMIVGQAIGRVDPRMLIVFGMLLTAASLHAMAGFTPDVASDTIVWTGVLQGFGLGFVFTPLATLAFATLDPALRTQGSALFALTRNVGSSIGVSMSASMLARDTYAAHAEIAAQVTPYNDALLLGGVAQWDLGTAAGRAALDAEMARQASAVAYSEIFALMAAVALAAIPFVLLLSRPDSKAGDDC